MYFGWRRCVLQEFTCSGPLPFLFATHAVTGDLEFVDDHEGHPADAGDSSTVPPGTPLREEAQFRAVVAARLREQFHALEQQALAQYRNDCACFPHLEGRLADQLRATLADLETQHQARLGRIRPLADAGSSAPSPTHLTHAAGRLRLDPRLALEGPTEELSALKAVGAAFAASLSAFASSFDFARCLSVF
eukprot:TRINITY_DN1555_c0_g1_i2.p2 TRINITY_DN1555_c0_g1~~TRINITY_DN1555_c0_g1_i2.p2  ORF type:complete len:191 (-),score=33.04 TRINITY_DN1555_c0_g1_i2:1674-2246(-)